MNRIYSKFRKQGLQILLTLGAAIAFSSPVQAAKFANQFTEFELPPQWQCNLEGAEWVCQSTNEAKKRDAIIVLAAKLKGDQDSLDQYLKYLTAAKTFTSPQGKPVKSEPKYAKMINLEGQPWVDSLHMESELPGFLTRYLATVKQDIGVLVTYSINKNKNAQYAEEFENMVRTLKVFRKAGGINVAAANTNLFANTQIPAAVSQESVFGAPTATNDAPTEAPKKESDDNTTLLLVLVVALGAFFIWKKKRAGG
jgi:hypothetical protein